MKLLVITQKVDQRDPILGFFHRWLEELAKNCDQVIVIALGVGDFNLPVNVQVLSMGKLAQGWSLPAGRLGAWGGEKWWGKFLALVKFFTYLWQERHNYDKVFVHMNPIYVVLAGWYWRLSRRPIGLWYTHRQVDWKLRIAAKLATVIFTAAPESFQLKSSKVVVTGHGIDTATFACPIKVSNTGPFIIMAVGRLTRIKHLNILLEATALLKRKISQPFIIRLVGEAVTPDDKKYVTELQSIARQSQLENLIDWRGAVSPEQMKVLYCRADLTVNLTPTGGLDKAVLESMAAGMPVLTSNQAFRDYLKPYQDELLLTAIEATELTLKLQGLLGNANRGLMGSTLQKTVQTRADLSQLIKLIIAKL